MDIQSLKYVIALEKEKNFSAAAAECALSQSALSKHLKKVEEELGGNIPLFDRTKRPIEITPAGQTFLRYAHRVVDDYEQLLQGMKKFDPQSSHVITVGAVPTMGRLGITTLIHTFSKSLPPEDRLEFLDRPSLELIGMLTEGALDAALIITTPDQNIPSKLTCYQLCEYEIVLVVGKGSPLAGRASVDLSELSGETFITTDQSTSMYGNCLAICKAAGFEPKRIKDCRNFDTVISLISQGAGVGLMGRKLVESFQHFSVAAVPMKEPCRGIVSLAIPNHAKLTPLTKKFIAFALGWEFDENSGSTGNV